MTVGSKVKQTLASLQGVRATLKTFSTIEKNKLDNDKLNNNILVIDGIIEALEERTKALEFEEPQYKGY